MKTKLFLLLLLLCFPAVVEAQVKSDAYYDKHRDELLHDAEQLFRSGNYDRALQLCDMHLDLLGTEHTESDRVAELKDVVIKCQSLAIDIESCLEKGMEGPARSFAELLKEINPSDERLKRFGLYSPFGSKNPKTVKEKPEAKDAGRDWGDEGDDYWGLDNIRFKRDFRDNLYAVGVSGGALGIGGSGQAFVLGATGAFYNLLWDFLGAETRLYGSNLAYSEGAMMGWDTLLNFHVYDRFFASVGPTWFLCWDCNKESKHRATGGLGGALTASAILGDHIYLQVGFGFYPEVPVWQDSTFKPKDVLDMSGSIWITLGWAF